MKFSLRKISAYLLGSILISCAYALPNNTTLPTSPNSSPTPPALLKGLPKAKGQLKIAVIIRPPFVMKKGNHYSGLAVDIWKKVAQAMHWKYTFTPVSGQLHKLFKSLNQGKFDALIGAIPVNDKGLAIVDFSRPIFINRIGILIRPHETFFGAINSIFSYFQGYKVTLISLLLLVLFVSHALWFAERNRKTGQTYWQAVGNTIWFGFLSLIAQETSEPRRIKSVSGRIILGIWLLFSVIAISILIATVTTALTLTVTKSAAKITVHELQNKAVAYVKNNIDEGDISKLGVFPVPVKNLAAGIQLLKEKEVTAVIGNVPSIHHYLRSQPKSNFVLSNFVVSYDEYAFTFPKNSPLRREFDIAFDHLKESEHISPLCTKYIGVEEGKLCSL